MSVTCKREFRCSLVGLTPVFIPFRSFNRTPGASVAIVEVQEYGNFLLLFWSSRMECEEEREVGEEDVSC